MRPELIHDIVEKADKVGSDHQLRLRFKLDILKRLAQKLADDTDADIENDLQQLAAALPTVINEIEQHKNYFHILKRVKIKAQKRFGYVPKGFLKKKHANDWLGAGIALGVALGVSFNDNGSGIGIGIAVGLALGLAIGQSTGASKEQQAEARGLTY